MRHREDNTKIGTCSSGCIVETNTAFLRGFEPFGEVDAGALDVVARANNGGVSP